eukprot:TRINITY_DN3949_c0_g1_i1.p1 TRINITY_DN3949_c0_g1~~TRINITY_DN3949_c0_g1_i1.p1  ORF type:complete len:127 (+),score=19.40 TRINITY_DN3949_c0_g1_i1:153-533(+)
MNPQLVKSGSSTNNPCNKEEGVFYPIPMPPHTIEEEEERLDRYFEQLKKMKEEKSKLIRPGLCLNRVPAGTSKEDVKNLFSSGVKEVKKLFPHIYVVYFETVEHRESAFSRNYYIGETELEIERLK